ncbi:MAG: 50S ribosomal protein L4 [Thermodesulfovibrionia bacterium]
MPEVEVFNKENKAIGRIELPSEIFGVSVKKGLLHEVVRNYLANQRQGTASTKTRGLVSGGGKKPWRQKGTGRARHGSIRSPIWRGGGTVFGPMPRDYSYRLPRKMKWSGLSSALSAKFLDGEVMVVDSLSVSEPKTRLFKEVLKGLGLNGNSLLVVLPERDRTIELASRNIPRVHVTRLEELNVYSILSHEKVIFTMDAIEKMKEVYL